jgi:hypothetical protein
MLCHLFTGAVVAAAANDAADAVPVDEQDVAAV